MFLLPRLLLLGFVAATIVASPLATAQRGVGAFVRQPGSERATISGPIERTFKRRDGSTKVFELHPYEDGYGDAPLGKDGERLPGLMFRLVIPDEFPLDLASPESGQKVVLTAAEPQDLPNFIASSIVIGSVSHPDQPSRETNSTVQGTGYFSLVVNPLGRGMADVAGLPYTRLDITRLRESKEHLYFYGRKWSPLATGTSLIIVTWDQVVGVNVRAQEVPASAPKRQSRPKK